MEYEIGESSRKEAALNPKHCIDIPYHILHTIRDHPASRLKELEPIVTFRTCSFSVSVEAEHVEMNKPLR